MSALTVAFAWLHVFFAVGWVGGALLMTMVLEPTLRVLSPAARTEFAVNFLPRVGIFMGLFSTFTIMSGIPLYFTITGGVLFPDGDGQWNAMLYSGVALALAVYIFGIVVLMPLTKKVEDVTKSLGANPSEKSTELQRLMAKMGKLSLIDLVLLIMVLTLMVSMAFF